MVRKTSESCELSGQGIMIYLNGWGFFSENILISAHMNPMSQQKSATHYPTPTPVDKSESPKVGDFPRPNYIPQLYYRIKVNRQD